MTLRIERATPSHFARVERDLLRRLNVRMPEERWRRLFDARWGVTERPLGSVLLDGNRAVGYAAYVHARLPRQDGPDALLCNVSSWVTAPGFSARSIALLMPALQLPQTTITNLTPNAAAYPIFARLGFVPLETSTVLLHPIPLARSDWQLGARETELRRILPLLPAWEARVAEDHGDLVQHLWIPGPQGRHCYVQYQRTRRRKLPAAKVLWVTPASMPEASVALRQALLRVAGAVLVEFEQRMLGPGPIPGAWRTALPQPRLFRPAGLAAADVPSAYSELPLLEI